MNGGSVMSEPMRGCGYRKIGGMYLCSDGHGIHCDVLPYRLHICPTCGGGIKFSRSFQWIRREYFEGLCVDSECPAWGNCFFTRPDIEKVGLMWVGTNSYTPGSFIKEAELLGVSKRISTIPKDLIVGETWVLFAHAQACECECNDPQECDECTGTGKAPGIFHAFIPYRIEMPVTAQMLAEQGEDLERRGITPILVDEKDIVDEQFIDPIQQTWTGDDDA